MLTDGRKVRKARVVGGSYAQDGQFPYHASIVIDGTFKCGGALIGQSHVLTAGHCFTNSTGDFEADDVKVLIGHTSINEEWNAKIIIGVDKVFTPSTYSESNGGIFITDDIAVLKVLPFRFCNILK